MFISSGLSVCSSNVAFRRYVTGLNDTGSMALSNTSKVSALACVANELALDGPDGSVLRSENEMSSRRSGNSGGDCSFFFNSAADCDDDERDERDGEMSDDSRVLLAIGSGGAGYDGS